MDDVGKPRSAAPSASYMDDGDDTFEAMLSDFQQEFQIKQDSMELVTTKVGQICEAALGAAGVRHTTISSRIKAWKSAEGSIRRKRHERAIRRQLRATVESRKQDWDTYCSHSNLEPRETGPFASAREMLNLLRDFGGIRISLYFPGDVDQISDIFKKRFKVDSETRKQQSKDVTMDLRRRLEKLESDNSIEKTSERHTERSFPGYKATHFHVRLLDEDIPSKKMAVWKDFVVEIQVGTLVMHAWSEIEHDLIYKPLEDSQTISEDEVRLLDLINGIVATGEAALRQLETSTKRRHNQRAGDKEASATSYHELGHWLEKYWVEVHKVKIDGDWEYLTQLYAITKGTGHHQLGKIQQILRNIEVNEVKHYRRLPIQMLEVICKPVASFQEPYFQGTQSEEKVLNSARFWATQFVHSMNMAIFFGIAGTFFNVPNLPKRPRIATILDIIHPTSPSYETMDTVFAIANYCEKILQYHGKKRERDNQLLRIATWLPRMGCVITSSEHDGILVPMTWMSLLIQQPEKKDHCKTESCQRTLLLPMRNWICSSDVTNFATNCTYSNMFATNYTHSNILAAETLENWFTSQPAVGYQFLVPNLLQESDGTSWKLINRRLHLDVSSFNRSIRPVQFEKSRYKPPDEQETCEVDEILEIEYRLRPVAEWDKVLRDRKAAIINPAGPWRILWPSNSEDPYLWESQPNMSYVAIERSLSKWTVE